MTDRLTELQECAVALYDGKDPDEWSADDDYLAVLPVHCESRNQNYYIMDSESIIVAGPMGKSDALRIMNVIDALMPKSTPLFDLVKP